MKSRKVEITKQDKELLTDQIGYKLLVWHVFALLALVILVVALIIA